MKKYYIQVISSNLLQALVSRASHDERITERYGFKCLNRKGKPISQDLFEVPYDICREILAKRSDYHFVVYVGEDENPPRNIEENFPHSLGKFEIRPKNARKGVIKGSSLLRRQKRQNKKFNGVH